jgi:hypothetical protein
MSSIRGVRSEHDLSFLIVGQHVRVECGDASIAEVIAANYGQMLARTGEALPDLHYVAAAGTGPGAFSLTRQGGTQVASADLGDLLFHLEKDVTVALQERRPDLLFLHAAALEYQGKVCVLTGDSGSGKSTTTWGLLHHGFRYLSDELAPIDLASLEVVPYPHALCMKQAPPPNYPLPTADILDFGRTMHVPVKALPGAAVDEPCVLGAMVFVRHRADLQAPVLRAISAAEASVRMYATTLNALAHGGRGLDAVLHVAERIPCFFLEAGELGPTCESVCQLIATLGPGRGPGGARKKSAGASTELRPGG